MIRASSERWETLGQLAAALERCVEANGRLDARAPERDPRGRPAWVGAEHEGVRPILLRLDLLAARIDREVDRLTCERLAADLARRRMEAAA